MQRNDAARHRIVSYHHWVYKLDSLLAWKSARKVSRMAYRVTMTGTLSRHYELANQIRRAALSIPANIAEGYGLGTRPQLIRGLRISLGSAYELRRHIRLAREVRILTPNTTQKVCAECDQVIRLLIGLLRKLQAKAPE